MLFLECFKKNTLKIPSTHVLKRTKVIFMMKQMKQGGRVNLLWSLCGAVPLSQRTDHPPTGVCSWRYNDSWDYWFYQSWRIRGGSFERPVGDTGCIDSPPHPNTLAPIFSLWIWLWHTQCRDRGFSVSPGLDGRRKCWCTLWSWRPKPSHSCRTSWDRRKKENVWESFIFHVRNKDLSC